MAHTAFRLAAPREGRMRSMIGSACFLPVCCDCACRRIAVQRRGTPAFVVTVTAACLLSSAG